MARRREAAATEKDARADTWEELGGTNEVKGGEESRSVIGRRIDYHAWLSSLPPQ